MFKELVTVVIPCCLFALGVAALPAKADTDMPAQYAAALILEVASFEKKIAQPGKEIAIYVFDDPDIQEHLKGVVGRKVGKAKLVSVAGGSTLPSSPPDILVIGRASQSGMTENAINYAKSTKVLSFTPSLEILPLGVAVGLAVGPDKKPKIMLDLKYSSMCGLKWNPAIMKRAQVVHHQEPQRK